MREFMTLLEAKAKAIDVNFTDLPAGTTLFHGTNEAAKFSVPKGPAWFTVTPEGAEQWQDWATPRKRGTPRTMTVRTNRPLRLIVLDTYDVWSELSYKLCREDEAHYGQLAKAVKKAGYDGWFSDTEVMISNTEEVLEAVTLEEGFGGGRAPLYRKFHGTGGLCGQAAVAINRVIFQGQGQLMGCFNYTFYGYTDRMVGHVVVLADGSYWDSDARPKAADEIEDWAMLDVNDPDYAEYADEFSLDWNHETASDVIWVKMTEAEVLAAFGRDKLEEMMRHLGAKPVDRLLESQGTTIYHGGSGPITGNLQTPFFTTSHLDMARSYARQKGRGDGRVTAFQLSPSANIATEAQAEKAADDAAIDWEGAHISDLFYAAGDYQDPALWDIMTEMGFDGVLINDYGYHDGFRQEPTYVIFNPAVLSGMQEIERVESR